MLVSDGIAPYTNETVEKLNQKQPLCAPPHVPPSPACSPFQIDVDCDMTKILYDFPRGTSCGPSQLRVQHLIDSLDAPVPKPLLPRLRAVLNMLLSGTVPVELVVGIAGATLTPLLKPAKGQRVGCETHCLW